MHHSCKYNQCFKNHNLLIKHFHGNGSGKCGCVLRLGWVGEWVAGCGDNGVMDNQLPWKRL